MSAPIGPGDWVECVESRQGTLLLRVGAIYQIEAVRNFEWSCDGCEPGECDQCGVRCVGLDSSRPGYSGGWICSRRFRPVYRPKSEIIQALKQPSPTRELEDA